MKATELRIGNWVKLDLVGTQNQVTQILEKGINCGSIGVLYEMVKPIPLTDEWLERFGFDDMDFGLYSIKQIRLEKDYEGFTINIGTYYSIIRHVNQLQNLYFALTGEELQIKEQ